MIRVSGSLNVPNFPAVTAWSWSWAMKMFLALKFRFSNPVVPFIFVMNLSIAPSSRSDDSAIRTISSGLLAAVYKRSGNSLMHGAHHDAQKFKMIIFPSKSPIVFVFPWISVKSKLGIFCVFVMVSSVLFLSGTFVMLGFILLSLR